jgi:hypothetical protein
MEHRSLEELRAVAVVRTAPTPTMSREEKLRRWAELLEAEGGAVASLYRIEYVAHAARRRIRSLGSPISVAYADPVLKQEGLVGDAFGDAVTFFELSDHQMHRILCYCTGGHALPAVEVARRIRAEMCAPSACVTSLWVISAMALAGVALAAAL